MTRFPHYRFPNPSSAPDDEPLAFGGDLSPGRLLTAYQMGIFPWFDDDDGPILWWSPNPRFVLLPDHFRIPRSTRQAINSGKWRLTQNTRFDDVIRACAAQRRPGQMGTWITQSMTDAYTHLHALGHVHSAEAWLTTEQAAEPVLAGGLYGIRIGNAFCGESMFHHVAEGSKVAFALYARQLFAEGVQFIDCQTPTQHLARFGATEVARDTFLSMLRSATRG